MDLGLNGKTALITGASKGIGLATAKVLADEGCNLVLVSRTISQEKLDTQLSDRISKVRIIDADLSKSGTAEDLSARFPEVDIIVNNAGAVPAGSISEIDEPSWRHAWDLKVFGYINMCRAFYSMMKRKGGGTIINIAGIGAILKSPRSICIATGNAAIIALTQSLGSTSHADNIRVLAINPGPTATERYIETRKLAQPATSLPFNRPAMPEDIGHAVAFLASMRSGYTSGAVLTIDGGLSAANVLRNG